MKAILSVNNSAQSKSLYFLYLFCFAASLFLFLPTSLKADNTSSDVDSVYTIVDRIPVFKGRPSNTTRFINRHMIYPDDAWRNGIEGVAIVSFVVSKDGSIVDPRIEKSLDPILDIEALRLVGLMDKWQAGKKNGKAVHTKMSLPIIFSLSDEEKEFVNTLKKYDLNENPPLYIIDGKIVKSRIHLPSYNIKSIRVVKGESAIEKYGAEANNGVVIISTKRGTPPVR